MVQRFHAGKPRLTRGKARTDLLQSLNPCCAAPMSPESLLSITTGTPNAGSDILRQDLRRVHAEFTEAAVATDAYLATRWARSELSTNSVYELMIVLKFQLLTPLLEHWRIHSTSYSVSSKLLKTQFRISKWRFSIRCSRWEKWHRSILMSEAFAELQHRTWTPKMPNIEQDQRLRAEQLNSPLSPGQARLARFRSQLVQEGETVESYYRVDKSSGKHIIGRDGNSPSSNETRQHQLRKLTWTISDRTCALPRHKASYLRRETQESSRHIKDVKDQFGPGKCTI